MKSRLASISQIVKVAKEPAIESDYDQEHGSDALKGATLEDSSILLAKAFVSSLPMGWALKSCGSKKKRFAVE